MKIIDKIELYVGPKQGRARIYHRGELSNSIRKRLLNYLRIVKLAYHDNWTRNTYYDNMEIKTKNDFNVQEERLNSLERRILTALGR